MAASLESLPPRMFWADRFSVAAGLLALGSAFLLLGAWAFQFVEYSLVDLPSWVLMGGSLFAVPLHLLAWHALWDAVDGVSVNGSRRFMRRVFRFSLAAFAAGLAIVLILAPFGWLTSMGGFFPYIPFVWAPVVICHSVIFVHACRLLRAERFPVWLGSGVLFGVAVFGLGMLAFPGLSHRPTWLMAGLTAPGYALVSFGWKRVAFRKPDPASTHGGRCASTLVAD